MKLQNLQQQYKKYEHFLESNEERYHMADKLVTEGVVASQKGMSVKTMDKVYSEASLFYMQYTMVKDIVAQMEDLGVHLTRGN